MSLKKLSKKAKTDLIVVAVFNILAFILFAITDSSERIVEFSIRFEQYEIDELFSVSLVLSLSLLIFAIRRIKETQGLMSELQSIATNDILTKLFNRKYAQKYLSAEVYRFSQNSSVFSLILIELDNFEHINERFGQQAGDQVLIRVANCLTSYSRTMDCVARWGGNEFLLVCPDTDTQEAIGITSKLLQQIRRIDSKQNDTITASFGLTSSQPGDDTETIINRVTIALRQAKQQGKNRFITLV